MNETFAHFLSDQKCRIESRFIALTEESTTSATKVPPGLAEATRSVITNGGKRIRPLLVFLAADVVTTGQRHEALDYVACAVELIHTYSLIHDDLPAMDDDDIRRGQPTLHKTHGEATAILVGDGLQALAFEMLAVAPMLSADQRISLVRTLSVASGPGGMVGGQYIDIQATGSSMPLYQLQEMHSLKTGALIRASLTLGGITAGANAKQLSALENYGSYIGQAFQVVDDILDVEGDTETLGKTRGKDSEADKPTYVKLMGLDGAKAEARRLLELALEALNEFDESADKLRELARFIVERDH